MRPREIVWLRRYYAENGIEAPDSVKNSWIEVYPEDIAAKTAAERSNFGWDDLIQQRSDQKDAETAEKDDWSAALERTFQTT